MGNKNNNLRHQKYLTLKNSDESFKKLADKVENNLTCQKLTKH